jgi:hypothetical protein
MGLFASVNGGQDWFRMKNNVPWYALVRDLKIHPKTNDLIIATHGRGILIVDDISSMRELSKNVTDKNVHLFETGDITLSTGDFGSGGFPSTGGWVSGNAPSLKPFQYFLKEKINTGTVKLEVYDKTGKLVQSVPASNRKGINRVTWSQRMMPPKTASGATKPDNGGAVAPQVLPGEYTVKLIAGKEELSQTFRMVHDAKSSFTLPERNAQFAAAMELYNLHLKLATIVAGISDKQKTYKDNIAKLKNKKSLKLGNDYITALETLRAELIPTKQTSIFADESRLREDITQVYLAICFNEAGPSNLQLESIKTLTKRVNDAEKKAAEINTQFEEKVKSVLTKEKL